MNPIRKEEPTYCVDIRIMDAPGWCEDWPVSPLFTILQCHDVPVADLPRLLDLVQQVDDQADVEVFGESATGRKSTRLFKGDAADCLAALNLPSASERPREGSRS